MKSDCFTWICPSCKKCNEVERHHDPNAHFVSVVCEACGFELEDCPCYDFTEAMRELGRRSWHKRKKTQNSDFFKKLAKKRWKKN